MVTRLIPYPSFVDRDMFMHYQGSGIGHKSSLQALEHLAFEQTQQTDEDLDEVEFDEVSNKEVGSPDGSEHHSDAEPEDGDQSENGVLGAEDGEEDICEVPEDQGYGTL
jgi:hypothetical protein